MSGKQTEQRTTPRKGEDGTNGHVHGASIGNGVKHADPGENTSPVNFRRLFEDAPVGYFILDRDGAITEANTTAARQLNVDHGSLQGKHLVEYIAAGDQKRFSEHLRKVFSTTAGQACELEFVRAGSGARRCMQLHSVAACEAQGEPVCYVTTTDTTERHRREGAERFLAEANAKLAQSIEYHTTLAQLARMCVPYLGDWCTVFIIESDGSIEKLATAHADPAKEAIVQELQRRFPPGRENPFAIPVLRGETVLIPQIDDKKLKATTQNDEHLEMVTRLGPTSMMIIPLMLHGRVLGALSLMSTGVHPPYNMNDVDLATRLADQAAMPVENARLFLEAQEAVKARDEFLSIASHELRTPLTSLTLQLQGLLKSVQNEGLRNLPQDRVKRRLEGAQEQVRRMTDLVNRLLDVSRISAGRVEVEPEDVGFAGLVGEVLDRFDTELRSASCHLTFDILDYPVVRADRFRLDQVVTNLISNAIKYGKGSPINVTVDSSDGKAVLSVRDQGIGIAPENRERIFERFERATGSTSVTGLGLGLYITRRLVDAMEGSITVASQIDFGSTFTVKLPLA